MSGLSTTQRAFALAARTHQSIARVSKPASAPLRRVSAAKVQCKHGRLENVAAATAATLAALVLTVAPTQAVAETFAPDDTSPTTEVVVRNDDTDGPGRNAKVPRRPGQVLLDYAKTFDAEEAAALSDALVALERDTGWKLRVVTGYGSEYPSVDQLFKYFAADRKTIVMTADEFKGNVIEFYYDTSSLRDVVPKNVFQEIRGRYGNKYYTDEEGLAPAVYTAADTLRGCLAKGGCKFVPGLSQQQREFSLIAVTSGGFLFGAVARGGVSAWTWVFCAIWVPWVGMFGFYPLYVRQPEDLTPLYQNAGIFAAIAAATALSPVFGEVEMPSAPSVVLGGKAEDEKGDDRGE